jgi:hypothetical protein
MPTCGDCSVLMIIVRSEKIELRLDCWKASMNEEVRLDHPSHNTRGNDSGHANEANKLPEVQPLERLVNFVEQDSKSKTREYLDECNTHQSGE